ncbi:MAG: IS21 family transposase [Candidatus Cloacimonetes bacterium]|nr:IS21 family transposase [Candidatus Cloacimonadota bacterium]
MYNTILTLRTLGKSQREIAAELRISKSTVNKYCHISEAEGEIHACCRAGRSEFAIAEDYIRDRLLNKPKLRLSRLYKEVIARHPEIRAKPRAFRKYVQKMKGDLPKPQGRVFSVVETQPGKQIQVDMGELRVDCSSGGKFKVYFCGFVLSFSRQLYVHCQIKPYNTDDFIDAHRQSFLFFGGLADEYIYDQTKLVAISEKYREVLFNQVFHQFALKAGFHPMVCEGYDPQSKGKIERCIKEVKAGFLYGSAFANLVELRNQMQEWLSVFNSRVHSTTKKLPQQLWNEEKKYLIPIPELFIQQQTRQADKTGLISYTGNKYSVPITFQNRMVQIEEEDGMLLILDPATGKTIATHQIPSGKGNLLKNSNHYRDFSQELSDLKVKTSALLSTYDSVGDIVEKLVKDNPKIARDQLRAVCKLANKFDKNVWIKAIPIIHNMQSLRATLIERILEDIERQDEIKTALSADTTQTIGESAVQRPLNDYMRILNHDREY